MSRKGYSATYSLLCVVTLLVMSSKSLIIPMILIFSKQIGAKGMTIGFIVTRFWIVRILLGIPDGLVSRKVRLLLLNGR